MPRWREISGPRMGSVLAYGQDVEQRKVGKGNTVKDWGEQGSLGLSG